MRWAVTPGAICIAVICDYDVGTFFGAEQSCGPDGAGVAEKYGGRSRAAQIVFGRHWSIDTQQDIFNIFGGSFLVNQTLTAFNTYFVLAFKMSGGLTSLVGVALLIASITNVPQCYSLHE